MSYDICLEMDTGGSHPACVTECRSPTYNLAPMFTKALGFGIRDLDGKTGEECKPLLRTAIAAMQDDRTAFEDLSPSNGWGNYEGAVKTFADLLQDCIDHPKATVRI